jgi:hypothetical protein
MKFPIPEGFDLPEGAESGSFEVLATVEVSGDALQLLAIDGVPVTGGSSEVEESEPDDQEYAEATSPDTGDFQKAVMMGMTR